ncbi:tRNA lysidine(34) synthetase TilS [Microbacterium esteraromaticum]|uniref:tRNA lysidine(34) synthetase TilS n=1 Tax=Microbacterium esteraromaticum TaxID=57043 RepID=UPI001C94897A|nr:tRNA lysidine(34) synthetase TilS [Microbacterium esteraromaticum]MBY6060068.1 tRNA lysidine(34) synthetase TilS [Microbacterium esteraromaticum]
MPSLNPAVAEIRRAVRTAVAELPERSTVIVALSGGADSLALTAATVFEARAREITVLSLTVDHQLQPTSGEVATGAAVAAEHLGVDNALSTKVEVTATGAGLEAAARDARYAAIGGIARAENVAAVLLGHTLDDQAETVLLGLARGAGAASLQGMPPVRVDDDGLAWMRPLLGVRRTTTRAFCAASDIAVWDDPHNTDERFARVRARQRVLPVLEAELGPGIAEALARTAEQLREDAAAFDDMIHETIEDIVEHAEAGISVSAAALAANPAALRNRIIRLVVDSEFGVSLTRVQTLEVARLATDWSGQGPIDLPACTAHRHGGRIVFTARS